MMCGNQEVELEKSLQNRCGQEERWQKAWHCDGLNRVH